MKKGRKRRGNYSNSRRIHGRTDRFAQILADPKARFKAGTAATTEKNNLKTYIKKPYDNAARIAATVREASVTSGVFAKVIDYYQSILTYNYTIYPVLGNKTYQLDTSGMQDAYTDIAYELRKYNIKYYAPYILKEILIDGVVFLYEVQDSTGSIEYLKMPIDWCKISGQENGVYRYMLDMSKVKSDVVDYLPEEIQTAYDSYQNKSGTDDTDKWYDKKWYFIENGVAFTFDINTLVNDGLAVSPMVGMIIDNLSLQQAKDNVDVKDSLDTVRLIHSKIPLDKDGVPQIDLETAKIFDNAIRTRMPEGVVTVTTPTALDNVPLTGSGNAGAYDTVGKSIEQLFYDLGTSSSLFGGSTTSSNIVKESIKKDAYYLYANFLPLLENYYNSKIALVKTSTDNEWSIKFIRQSNFTLDDDTKRLKEQLSFGGSRLDYMAACGFLPEEIVPKLEFEQRVMNIDSIMVVKPTSNTISGKQAASDSQAGRPTESNPSDDTERINDSQ